MTQGRLEGRTALVTGAGRGLGSALALGLARAGADVIVHYNRSQEGAERVAGEIEALGRRASTVQADITQLEQVEAMAERCGSRSTCSSTTSAMPRPSSAHGRSSTSD